MCTKNKFIISQAKAEDIESLQVLWKKLYELQKLHGYAFSFDENAVSAWGEGIKKQLGRFYFVWMANTNGVAHGFLVMRLLFSPSQYGRHLLAHISELYVEEKFRSFGLGSSLVREAIDKAIELKVHSIEVQTMYGNTGAKKFWEKLGFPAELVQFRKIFTWEQQS